jgi:hypothetical protein
LEPPEAALKRIIVGYMVGIVIEFVHGKRVLFTNRTEKSQPAVDKRPEISAEGNSIPTLHIYMQRGVIDRKRLKRIG